MTNPRRTVLFVSCPDEPTLRLAGACALAATAAGDRVDVFLLGGAVRAFLEAAEDREEGSAARFLQARELGECRLLACSASLVESGLDPVEAGGQLDAVIGWPTILEWTRGVVDRFCF